MQGVGAAHVPFECRDAAYLHARPERQGRRAELAVVRDHPGEGIDEDEPEDLLVTLRREDVRHDGPGQNGILILPRP